MLHLASLTMQPTQSNAYDCVIVIHDCVLGSKKLSCTGTPAAGRPKAVSSTWVVMGDFAMVPCDDWC